MKVTNMIRALLGLAVLAGAVTASAQTTCPAGQTLGKDNLGRSACFANTTAAQTCPDGQPLGKDNLGRSTCFASTATAQTECPAGQTWKKINYWGGACFANKDVPMVIEHVQQQAQQDTANRQLQQQAEYQQRLLDQQAQYQQQQLRQQADIARRQMLLQYMMNRPTPQPYVLPMPQAPVVPNNQMHCTTQYIGGTAYTNCY